MSLKKLKRLKKKSAPYASATRSLAASDSPSCAAMSGPTSCPSELPKASQRRCECCKRPARHWYVAMHPDAGHVCFRNGKRVSSPRPEAFCCTSCARELNRDLVVKQVA